MAVVEPNSGKPRSAFLFFFIVSILWHGFQLLLFTFILKVESPRVFEADRGRRLVAQVLVPMESSVDSNWNFSRSLKEQPLVKPPKQESPFVVVERSTTLAPKALDSARLKPIFREDSLITSISSQVPVVTPAKVSLSNEKKLPFGMSGELQVRKLVSHPPLPSYPEWALVAAVELDLEVGLSVDESGVPHQVFIKEGCGDSQTDLSVLEYVEQMRFEPSLGVSRGTIQWAFRLDR